MIQALSVSSELLGWQTCLPVACQYSLESLRLGRTPSDRSGSFPGLCYKSCRCRRARVYLCGAEAAERLDAHMRSGAAMMTRSARPGVCYLYCCRSGGQGPRPGNWLPANASQWPLTDRPMSAGLVTGNICFLRTWKILSKTLPGLALNGFL